MPSKTMEAVSCLRKGNGRGVAVDWQGIGKGVAGEWLEGGMEVVASGHARKKAIGV